MGTESSAVVGRRWRRARPARKESHEQDVAGERRASRVAGRAGWGSGGTRYLETLWMARWTWAERYRRGIRTDGLSAGSAERTCGRIGLGRWRCIHRARPGHPRCRCGGRRHHAPRGDGARTARLLRDRRWIRVPWPARGVHRGPDAHRPGRLVAGCPARSSTESALDAGRRLVASAASRPRWCKSQPGTRRPSGGNHEPAPTGRSRGLCCHSGHRGVVTSLP